MLIRTLALLTALALPLAAGPAVAIAAKPAVPSIAQLAAYPKMSGFSLSPDGKRLAGLEARGEDRVILVWETDKLGSPPTVIGSEKMKIQSVGFAKNDVLAVTLWQPVDIRYEGLLTKTFVSKFYFTDLDGKNWREPLPQPRAMSRTAELEQSITSPELLDTLINDPDQVLLVNNVGNEAGDVYRVNVRNGRADRIQRREEDVGQYVTDLTGALRARFRAATDGEGAFVAAEFRNASGTWEEHFRSYVKSRDVTEVVGFTKDPNIALIRSNVGRDKAIIYEYDVAKRAKVETLFEHPYFDASGVRTVRFNGPMLGEIAGLIYDGPRTNDVSWVAPEFRALDQTIRQAVGIRPVPTRFVDPETGKSATTNYDAELAYDLTSYTSDLKTALFTVSGPNRPPAFYLMRDGKLNLLARAFSDIDPGAFGTTKLVYYKARDGLDIPAFLTTPNTELCGAGPWKTVIHPHGGPWARDDLRFDASMWIPLMASRCMAVLQPQYRGSDGWGRRLWKAGDAEWGGKMQDDKDDGVKWLIEQKIADPQHVAMFGFSYGGYASMAAAVRPNGLYKCAIAGAGVSDISRIVKGLRTSRFFLDAQGPTIKGLSPLDQADAIKIPIMVYHGERDQTVPIEQSEWFVAKAKRSDQPVVYHEFADYAHGPAWTRKIMGDQLQVIDDYFGTGCGTGGL